VTLYPRWDRLAYLTDVDQTGKAAGKAVVVAADGETHEYGDGGGVTPEAVRDAGRWEVVVAGTPPEAVTDDDEIDWLYAWTGGPS
jgi:hypothetical protein